MKNFITTTLLPLCYYFLLGVVVSSCSLGQLDITGMFNNQGVIGRGDNTGNTQTMEVDFKQLDIAGSRILTPKEKEVAKKAFDRGAALVHEQAQTLRYGGAKLHYISTNKFRRPDIDTDQMLRLFPKLQKAHKDLLTLLTEIYRIHASFIVAEVARTKKRAAKLKKKGRSWTNNSRHTWNPPTAADIVPKRKGKVDYNDIDALGMYQGIAVTLGVYLETLPCEVFGSTVERVIDWRTVRDLYHIQINVRKECV